MDKPIEFIKCIALIFQCISLFHLNKTFFLKKEQQTIIYRKYVLLVYLLKISLNVNCKYTFLRDADRGFGKCPTDQSKF